MSKKRAKHEYVVGYPGDTQVVYGREWPSTGGGRGIATPLTARQAISKRRQLLCTGSRIFRLVDVTEEVLGAKR